ITVIAVSVLVHVQARSVVRGNPSASDSVTRVSRQVPAASNCQLVVQVWTSPGTWITTTACQVPTSAEAELLPLLLAPEPKPLPGRSASGPVASLPQPAIPASAAVRSTRSTRLAPRGRPRATSPRG